MKFENYEVTGNCRLTKKVVGEIFAEVDLREEEQTYINADYVYEAHIDNEDGEVYIKRYSYNQYASQYGEATLEDLKERLI